MALLLTGDIGGTNSRFALYDASETELSKQGCVYRHSFKNADYDSFNSVLDAFFEEARKELGGKVIVVAGCLAVAGPVNGNVVTFTNTVNKSAFVISAPEVEKYFHIPHVKLLNDFAANGYGLLTLKEDEMSVVCEPKVKVEGPAPIACIGAGTGLGECFLTPDAQGNYTAFATEGGHVEFSPRNDLEIQLLQFLHKKFTPHLEGSEEGKAHVSGRVSVERIVSGKGLVNVYEFLADKFPDKVNPAHHQQILSSTEGGRDISLFYHEDCLCHQALNIMLSTYGSEAGNVCLKYLPYGGLYIAGGIAPVHETKIIDPSKSDFLAAFHDKGRVSGVLDNIRVVIVKADDLGLRGAHFVANSLHHGQSHPRPTPDQHMAHSVPVMAHTSSPQSTIDRAFYACGVATVVTLAAVGLTTIYKQLHN